MLRRRAFTLIELLTVVSCMVILAGILFPAFAQARRKALQATCVSNLAQISRAHLMYIEDCGEALPSWYSLADDGTVVYWSQAFQPYLRNAAVLFEPAAQGTTLSPDAGQKLAEYALLSWGPGGTGLPNDVYWCWPGAPRVTRDGSHPMFLAEVCRPSETMSLGDGYTIAADGYTGQARTGITFFRHADAINCSFMDGHVKLVTAVAYMKVVQEDRGLYYYHLASADRK